MKINKISLQVIVHVAAWLCFLVLPFAFVPRPKDGPFIPDQYISVFFILTSLMYISFYYLNFYVLIPKLVEKKKVGLYILLIICLLLFFGTFPRLYRYLSDDMHKLPPIPWQTTRPPNLAHPILSSGSIAIFLLLFIISTGIKVVSQWFGYEQKTREIENEKLNTELSFLKSQINPHFLFNTLNNIYSLAEARSEKTSEAVMKLSSIMRYVLTEAKNNAVPLEKEIQFTAHYIELQKMRLTGKSKVDFIITGDPTGKQISPLLFLPFVENAFKYGISTREVSPINILLDIKNDDLDFKILNNKYNHALLRPAETTGIGITNIKRRLELLYHNRYKLCLADDKTTYSVNLNIHL
jgi:two-component system LytT family sensor kinase